MRIARRFALTAAAVTTLIVPAAHAQSTGPAPAVAHPSATTPTPNTPAQQASNQDETPARPSFDSVLGTVLARPGGITSDRVAERAAQTSFDVRARQQDVLVAATSLDQAIVAFFPRLTLTARYSRLSPITPPSFGNIVVAPEYANATTYTQLPAGTQLASVPLSIPVLLDQAIFQASVNVPVSDYLFRAAQAYAAATHSRRAAEMQQRAAAAMSAFNGRMAWWNLVRARLSVLVANQGVEQSQEHLTDVQHMEAAGAVSEADVALAQSRLSSAQLLALRARDLAAVTEDQVRTAMHLENEGAIEVGDDVRTDSEALRGEHDFTSLYDEALTHRPEIMALSETVGSLREQVGLTRSAGYPRIDVFGDLLTANPNPRQFPPIAEFTTTWDVGVGLTWSPNDLGLALVNAHGAEARAAAAAAQRGVLRDQVRNDVMGAFTAVRDAIEAIRASAVELSSAEESYRVRRVLFRNGRATSVELTDADADLTRARFDALNARVDLRVARVRLEHATGRDAAVR